MSWSSRLPASLQALLPSCFLRLRTRLSCRHNLGNLFMVLLVGTAFYFLALQPLSRVVEQYHAETMLDVVEDVQRICEQSYSGLLLSGVPPDSPQATMHMAMTLSFLEDFIVDDRVHILLVANEQILLEPATLSPYMGETSTPLKLFDGTTVAAATNVTGWPELLANIPSQPGKPLLMSQAGRKFYLQGGSFSPWEWQFVIFKDTTFFSNTIETLRYAYFGTIAILVVWLLLSGYFFRRQVESPIRHLIDTLERGEKPNYRGVAEFEFLSDRFAAAMAEQEVMRRRFFQQQKSESISVMAGGIAHDFNNLLAALYGQIGLAGLSLPAVHPAREHLALAESSADRARFLTRQMLDFATGTTLRRQALKIDELLRQTAEFALTGSRCELVFKAEEPLWEAELDAEQMGNVFHNLVLNGREAMEEQGRLTITCANRQLTADDEPPLPPGPYLQVVIKDEGCGMDSEVIGRIFEPYFSTKEKSSRKGTGLGLAICHSVITRHGGHIEVDSCQGLGSGFTIYLPAAESSAGEAGRVEQGGPVVSGS